MIAVYGLRNCDTCRKALRWLETEGIECRFRDLRSDGLAEGDLAKWIEALGWEKLLNRRSATWRSLAGADKTGLDAAKAATLMSANPALIKRPVFDAGEFVLVGFGDAQRQALSGVKNV